MSPHLLSLVLPFWAAAAFAQFTATITITDLGTGAPVQNASVQLGGDLQLTDVLGQAAFTGLAGNTYEYTVSATCYTSGLGSVTIASADATASLALEVQTTNNVFFFIGSPLAIMGATVQLTDGADYNVSFVTDDPFGDMVESVPYGQYTYAITLPCYETVTGAVTVECNNGDGIAVFAEPVEATANNVFFFIGSPLVIMGATVQLTDGADYNVSFVTDDPFGDMVESVPYGEYTYTITLPCYETVTGAVTVECNNGDGMAVFAEPVEIILDATVTLDGNVLLAAAAGLEYQWVDCDNGNAPIDGATGQSFAPVENGNYAVTITSGNCSQTSSCTEVTVTGTPDIQGRDAFLVYPNPFTDVVTVRTTGAMENVRVELFNATGAMVLGEKRSAVDLITVRTAHLPSGNYLLHITSDSARITLPMVK